MGIALQMNVRIDDELKAAGDSALAEAGYTPSCAVRLLWQRVSDMQGRPEQIVDLLDPRRQTGVEADRMRRRAAIERGRHLCDGFLLEHGVDPGVPRDGLPNDAELREEAFLERWAERGLV